MDNRLVFLTTQLLDAFDRRRTGFPLDYEEETAIYEATRAECRALAADAAHGGEAPFDPEEAAKALREMKAAGQRFHVQGVLHASEPGILKENEAAMSAAAIRYARALGMKPAAHGGERAQALDEDGAPAGIIILRRRVESLAARYGATRRDITFAGQQVAETLRSLLIYPSAECPATVTGNPLDCGGCPEHAAPAAAPSPETEGPRCKARCTIYGEDETGQPDLSDPRESWVCNAPIVNGRCVGIVPHDAPGRSGGKP